MDGLGPPGSANPFPFDDLLPPLSPGTAVGLDSPSTVDFFGDSNVLNIFEDSDKPGVHRTVTDHLALRNHSVMSGADFEGLDLGYLSLDDLDAKDLELYLEGLDCRSGAGSSQLPATLRMITTTP